MKMKIEPVEILLEDNKAFAQVAFLLDNPLFLKDLKKLRDKYKIVKPLDFSFYDFICHFIELRKGNAEKLLKENDFKLNLSGLQYIFEEPERLFEYLIEHQSEKQLGQDLYEKAIDIEQQFIKDINDIRKKYLYPPMFNSCIFQAVLFNKVEIFRTAFATFINTPAYPFESNQNVELKREKVMAIIATPYSTKDDILDAFKQGLTDVRNTIEPTHPLNLLLKKDTISNIKRDREWYWRVKNNEKYGVILDEWNEKCPAKGKHPNTELLKKCKFCKFDTDIVGKALLQYRKMLQFTP